MNAAAGATHAACVARLVGIFPLLTFLFAVALKIFPAVAERNGNHEDGGDAKQQQATALDVIAEGISVLVVFALAVLLYRLALVPVVRLLQR